MNVTRPLLASAGFLALMAAVSVWAWPHMPAQVPVHFGADWRPNGWAPRAQAACLMPLIGAGLTLLMAVVPQVMPRQGRLERSPAPFVVSWLGMMALMTVLHGAILLAAAGTPIDLPRVVLASMGGMFAVLGNVLGKARYNYVVGIRTPWTLASEAVWDRTHRATAPWATGGGVLLAAYGLLAPASLLVNPASISVVVGLTAAPMLGGAVYSYFVSRQLERRADGA